MLSLVQLYFNNTLHRFLINIDGWQLGLNVYYMLSLNTIHVIMEQPTQGKIHGCQFWTSVHQAIIHKICYPPLQKNQTKCIESYTKGDNPHPLPVCLRGRATALGAITRVRYTTVRTERQELLRALSVEVDVSDSAALTHHHVSTGDQIPDNSNKAPQVEFFGSHTQKQESGLLQHCMPSLYMKFCTYKVVLSCTTLCGLDL